MYRIFFSDLNRLTNKNLVIKNHFGEGHDLPLLLNSVVTESEQQQEKKLVIENTGILNKEEFNQRKFNKHIKSMTGLLDIDASLNVEAEERYVFDENTDLKSADLYLKTHAANMYALANAFIVERIDEKKSEELILEYSKK